MKRIAISFVLLCCSVLPALADVYAQEVHQAQTNYFLAQMVEICGLRSARWFDTFTEGYAYFVVEEARRLKVQMTEGPGLSLDEQRRLWAAYPCDKLAGSSTLATLDRIEYALRGGYR